MITFTTVRQSLTIAAIAALAGTFVSAPAAAEVTPTVAQTSVSFADLDLSTPGGQSRMHRRLRNAAHQVCNYVDTERDVGTMSRQDACVAKAMKGAELALAAVTGARSGQRVAMGVADRDVLGRAH